MSDPFVQFLEQPTRERYTQLVVAYMPAVDRLVRRLVRSDDVASDIVQDTFLALGKKRPAPAAVRNPRSYVLGVAFHLVKRHLRDAVRRSRHERRASRMRPGSPAPGVDGVAARESVHRLLAAIDALPRPLRIAMHLHAVEGLSYAEIAAVTGASAKAISMRIARARQRLRTALGEGQLAVAILKLEETGPEPWFLRPPARPPELPPAAARVPRAGVSLGAVVFTGILAFLNVRVPSTSPLREAPSLAAAPRRESGPVEPPWREPRPAVFSWQPPAPPRGHSRSIAHLALASRADREAVVTNVSPDHSQEGATMKTSAWVPALFSIGISTLAHGAETGDFDGDGRVSIADVMHAMDGLPAAPGSKEAFDAHICQPFWGLNLDQERAFLSGITYLESLRRAVPGSPPHWVRLWPEQAASTPLFPDPSVILRLERTTAAGDGDDRARLRFTLTTFAPIRAFSFALESDGDILHVPAFSPHFSPDHDWISLAGSYGQPAHAFGDLPVAVSAAAYLITGGKYVVNYGLLPPLSQRARIIEPGDYRLETEVRLPLGTAPGSRSLKVLPGAEVLLEDGTLVAPTIEGTGEVSVLAKVTTGWDEGVPPLDVDFQERRLRGKVEFRVAGAGGPPGEGEPAAEGLPGEVVRFRVQMHTEVPLNRLFFRLEWPPGELTCAPDGSSVSLLFASPEDGSPYLPPTDGTLAPICTEGAFGFGPSLAAWFALRGGFSTETPNYPERRLEYFKPLGEWVDLAEVRLGIPACARGGAQIPLVFRPYDPSDARPSWSPAFLPYDADFPCTEGSLLGEVNWRYDVVYHDSSLRVAGVRPGCADPPPDLGVRVLLGEASGSVGEIVEVPVLASAESALSLLRIALELDPSEAAVEAADFRVFHPKLGEFIHHVVPRSGTGHLNECEDVDGQRVCTTGDPWFEVYRGDTEDRFVVLEIFPGSPTYPGQDLSEIASLQVRLREDVRASEVVIRHASVPFDEGDQLRGETGGFLPMPDQSVFSPAVESLPGVITIRSRGFLRGDSNHDARVDLSDAVAALLYLFAGVEAPPCLDAADVDDSGVVEITDPIFLLGALFLGTKTIPQPFPACGQDFAADELGCQEGCP